MTVIVPTGELVGLLSDVIPFADTDKDFTVHTCVRVHWDGTQLHAEATDTASYGHSFWHPNDDPDPGNEVQESLFGQWGSGDDPWSIVLELADAKDIVKNYKLGPKDWGITLQVSHDERGRISIRRDRDERHSALRQDIDGRTADEALKFPNIEGMLAERAKPASGLATEVIGFNPRRLAALVKVRQRGPVVLDMWGRKGAVRVRIGDRFTGAIQPAMLDEQTTSRAEATV